MEKELILVAVVLLLIPLASAEHKEEVFNDWVYDGGNISADGEWFLTSVGSKTPVVGITQGEESILIRFSECNKIGTRFSVCFKEREVWYEDRMEKTYYKARIEIYRYLAKIDIIRSFEKTYFLIGEESGASVILKNSGSMPAERIEFNEDIPLNFTISDFTGCYLNGNSIRWKGELGVGEHAECSYKLKALTKIDYISSASVSYFNGKEVVTENSGEVQLTVPDYSLAVSFNLSEEPVEIRDETEVIITLKNLDDEKEIVVSDFSVNIPPGLEVVSTSYGLKKSGDKVTYYGALLNSSSKELHMTVKPTLTGVYNLTGNARFQISGILKDIEFSSQKKLSIYSTNLSILTYMPSVVRGGKNFEINLSVRNPSSYTLKNIHVEIESDVPGFENESFGIINTLERGETANLRYMRFKAPEADEDRLYYVNVYASYTTPYFELIKINDPKTIEVKGTVVGIKEIDIYEENESVGEEETMVVPKEEKPATVEKKMDPKTRILIFLAIFAFIAVDIVLVSSIIKKLRNRVV